MANKVIKNNSTLSIEAPINAVEKALEAIRSGKIVIVTDDSDRENEGDIVFAAQFATEELMAWTIKYSSGVVCVPMTQEWAERRELPPMVSDNQDAKKTAFTVSCDASSGITTGISAFDRSVTARVLANEQSTADSIVRPGHIFPLRAEAGGVLSRRGHTEAAVDLCELAGVNPVGVIAEIITEDGKMMREPQLSNWAQTQDVQVLSVDDIVQYRKTLSTSKLAEGGTIYENLTSTPNVKLPTPYGIFDMQVWTDNKTHQEHVSLSVDWPSNTHPLVRVHSECLTGDVFGSYRCDCGQQLQESLKLIAQKGGVLIYMKGHEGRGIGLKNKIKAYALQDKGADTVEANEQLGLPIDSREYDAAAAILNKLGIDTISLITNNPDKVTKLTDEGIHVEKSVHLPIAAREENKKYLTTKKERMNHELGFEILNESN